jgi:hypothetical protein
MVIKASATAEIRQLVRALGGEDDVALEAAVARLAIIGERAVSALIAAYRATSDRRFRLGVLRVLERAADERTLAIARDALGLGGDLAIGGANILRTLLQSPDARTSAAALDLLMAVVLDESAEHRMRLTVAEALGDMPGVRARLAGALAGIPEAAAALRAGEAPLDGAVRDAAWQDALEGRLPDRPDLLGEAVRAHGATAALSSLQTLVDAVRVHEGTLGADRSRGDWRAVRGALHQALALRGSRVALYDLRETVAGASGPLPPSFLGALHAVGDASCLDGIAAAYETADDARWKAQLRETFHAIARRERLTRRTAPMKRLASRRPAAFRALTG